MTNGANRGNSTVKTKNLVWRAKVGVYSPVFIRQIKTTEKSKPWKIKVILN